MFSLSVAHEVAQLISSSTDLAAMEDVLSYAATVLCFDYFALHHHPAAASRYVRDLRIHNYPREWEESYDRRRLGLSDPVHRTSQRRAFGFRWRDMHTIIPFYERDITMLDEARQFGIWDGFTIPEHVPGERPGSVTFAFDRGREFPDEALLLAEGLGDLAFQQAMIIDGRRPPRQSPRLTDRQLEVVVLIGQDKTNSEIGDILAIREDTVMKHVRNICERLEAVRRTSLPLRAVSQGLLIFDDILR